MYKTFYTSLPLLLLFLTINVYGQKDLRIGDWNIYHPFRLGNHITQSEDQVYFTSRFAVVAFDKQDHSEKFITKLDGLSDAKTNLVKYSPLTNELLVTYEDFDFDLISEGTVTTFSNLRLDGNFFNRTINDIILLKDSMAYFCTAYGVVEFNLLSTQFGFTANLGINVSSIAIKDGYYFVATEEGIYTAKDDPAVNLKDNNNWKLLDINDGFPIEYSASAVVNYEGELYMAINDTLFNYTDGVLDSVYYEEDFFIKFLTAESEHLLLGLRCLLSNCGGKMLMFDKNGDFVSGPRNCIDRPRYAIEDQYGQLWFADSWDGFRMAASEATPCEGRILFNAPFHFQSNDLKISDGELWVASEIISPSSYSDFNQGYGFYHYKKGEWTNFNRNTNTVMQINGGKSCYTVEVNPDNGKVYVGTLSNGLIEYDPATEELQYYTSNTSILEQAIGDVKTRIGGMAFDDEGNLWMSNNLAGNPIAVLKADGTLINRFDIPGGMPLRHVAIDPNGYKWFTVDKKGLIVYDDRGTLDNPSDDRHFEITTSSTLLPNENVRCITIDLDGEVWVGTKEGVIIFDCGSVFEGNCVGFKRQVTVGGIPAYLLESEDVFAIAVDGANRKWFGTENGVFVQSADGKEALAYFNEKNSPLLDDVIYDIEIDQQSGEVFIATAKGIVSLQSDALEGGEFHNESEIYAYPNPVRSEYTGPIAIKGLTRDANVKITDINGQLIYETTALGGQAIWDGRDYSGRKASSGVYLVYSTSSDTLSDPDAIVTKILVMN